MTLGKWQSASACVTWLWWPCRRRIWTTRRCARVESCRWHTYWREQASSIHPDYPSPHASQRWRGRLYGRFEYPIPVVGWDCTVCVRREAEERYVVEEVIGPDGIEGFDHVEENCAGEPFFTKIPGYSFNKAGQLQRSAISGSEPKLLVPQQSAFLYYI